MTQLPKLVRDKIPESIRERGAKPYFRVLDRNEFQARLLEKVQEELLEFDAEPSAEELADVMEVLRALAENSGISYEAIEPERIRKYQSKGGFDQRILLERIDEPLD